MLFIWKVQIIFLPSDLAHFEIPFFPEIRDHHVFETRELLYRTALPRAYAITVGHSLRKKYSSKNIIKIRKNLISYRQNL